MILTPYNVFDGWIGVWKHDMFTAIKISAIEAIRLEKLNTAEDGIITLCTSSQNLDISFKKDIDKHFHYIESLLYNRN